MVQYLHFRILEFPLIYGMLDKWWPLQSEFYPMPIPFGGTTCFWDREPETPCHGQDGTTRYQAGQKRCFASCGIVVGRCLGSSTGGLGLRNYITSPKLTSMQLPIFNRATSAFHLGFHRCWDPLRTAVGRGIHEQIHASSSPQKGLSHVSMGWLTVGWRTLDETIRLFSDLSPHVPILSIDDFLIFKFLLRKVLFLFSRFTSPMIDTIIRSRIYSPQYPFLQAWVSLLKFYCVQVYILQRNRARLIMIHPMINPMLVIYSHSWIIYISPFG